MLKKRNRILWIIILIVFILFILELQKGIFHYANAFGSALRVHLFDTKSYISQLIDNHFNQAKTIQQLREIQKEKEKNDIIIANLQEKLYKLNSLLEINQKPNLLDIHLVEAYAYVSLGKYSQVWLKNKDITQNENLNKDKVFGLIKDGFAAGIATFKEDSLLGILNGDSKASYGVYIGESKSIGILKTNISGEVVVEYINAWNEIKEGDEIYTNGLDGIFFEGIAVGKVKKVRQEYGYIVTDVELYNKNNDIGYFWLVNVNT